MQTEQPKDVSHEKNLKLIWGNLETHGYGKPQWIMIDIHYDDYNLTEQEYFEIAKYAVVSWPDEALRAVTPKNSYRLSAENYYNICKAMVLRGVFYQMDYQKLQKAKIEGINNPVHDIINTILLTANVNNENGQKIHKRVFDWFQRNDVYAAFLAHKVNQLQQNIVQEITREIKMEIKMLQR